MSDSSWEEPYEQAFVIGFGALHEIAELLSEDPPRVGCSQRVALRAMALLEQLHEQPVERLVETLAPLAAWPEEDRREPEHAIGRVARQALARLRASRSS